MSEAAGRRCGTCGASLGERQRWCLACGSPTLTQVAEPGRWVAAAGAATLITVLALIGIGYAVATLLAS